VCGAWLDAEASLCPARAAWAACSKDAARIARAVDILNGAVKK